MTHLIPLDGDGVRPSLVERQAKLIAACSSFIKIGFRRELFTITNIHEEGYTDNAFLEFIKPITSITDLDELIYLFDTARQLSYYPPSNDEFHRFIYYMNWLLDDEEGKEVMAEVSTRILKKKNLENKKLEKKKEITKSNVAVAQMLVDYAASRKQKREGIQKEIAELRKRKYELKMESSSIISDLREKLGPIYEYEEPSKPELNIEAYKLYEEDCRSKGLTATPKHEEMGFPKAVEAFGDVVKKRCLVKYLNDPVRKENIENYFKERVVSLKYVGGKDKKLRDNDYRNFVIVESGEALNENANIVLKFVEEVFAEPQEPDSKRARSGKQSKQEDC